jgi:hypothetical protein
VEREHPVVEAHGRILRNARARCEPIAQLLEKAEPILSENGEQRGVGRCIAKGTTASWPISSEGLVVPEGRP